MATNSGGNEIVAHRTPIRGRNVLDETLDGRVAHSLATSVPLVLKGVLTRARQDFRGGFTDGLWCQLNLLRIDGPRAGAPGWGGDVSLSARGTLWSATLDPRAPYPDRTTWRGCIIGGVSGRRE